MYAGRRSTAENFPRQLGRVSTAARAPDGRSATRPPSGGAGDARPLSPRWSHAGAQFEVVPVAEPFADSRSTALAQVFGRPDEDPLTERRCARRGWPDRHIVGRVLRRSLRLVGALRLKFCSASDEQSAPLIWPVNRCTDVPRGREPAVPAVRPIRRSGAGHSTRKTGPNVQLSAASEGAPIAGWATPCRALCFFIRPAHCPLKRQRSEPHHVAALALPNAVCAHRSLIHKPGSASHSD